MGHLRYVARDPEFAIVLQWFEQNIVLQRFVFCYRSSDAVKTRTLGMFGLVLNCTCSHAI